MAIDTDLTRKKVSSMLDLIASIVVRLGVPTGITIWFFCWYLPHQEASMERRIQEIVQENQRNRQSQADVMKSQTEAFQQSLREMAGSIAILESTLHQGGFCSHPPLKPHKHPL